MKLPFVSRKVVERLGIEHDQDIRNLKKQHETWRAQTQKDIDNLLKPSLERMSQIRIDENFDRTYRIGYAVSETLVEQIFMGPRPWEDGIVRHIAENMFSMLMSQCRKPR